MTDLLTSIVTSVPWYLRLLLALAFIVAGGLVLWFVSLRLGIVLLGGGFVLLMFSGQTDSEKNGYRF
jgi:hypothetical protein